MVALMSLWLPIVLSALVVFGASAVVWMVLPHHKPDFKGVPDEPSLLEALRKQKLSPGQYLFPFCPDPKTLKEPEVIKKFNEGPVGVLNVMRPGPPNMSRSMTLSVGFNLVVSFFVAYVASRTLAPGSEYLHVFRVTGTVAFMTYSGGLFWGAIWMGRPWIPVLKEALDGLLYGLLTAGMFGWLWPS